MSSEHQEKHPGDIVGRSKQGAVLHASCQQYLYHRPHAGRMSGQCRSDLVSDSLNLRRGQIYNGHAQLESPL